MTTRYKRDRCKCGAYAYRVKGEEGLDVCAECDRTREGEPDNTEGQAMYARAQALVEHASTRARQHADDYETVRAYPHNPTLDGPGRVTVGCERCEEGVWLHGGPLDELLVGAFVREHRRCRFVSADAIGQAFNWMEG